MIFKITTPIIEPTEGSPHALINASTFSQVFRHISFLRHSFLSVFFFKHRYSYRF